MDSVDAVKVKQHPTSNRENGVELFEQNVGSQEKVVQLEKAVLKPHKVEPDEVKPRFDSEKVEPIILRTELPSGLIDAANHLKVVDSENIEYGALRIRLYPSPKRRKVPVFRDFPMALEQFSRQVDQEINKPLISEDEIESEGSLTYSEFGLPDDLEMESDWQESVHVFHDFPTASKQVGRQVDQEINKPLASKQLGGEVDQEINKPLVLEYDIESDKSLMNTEMLGLLGDLKVESNRLESVVAHDQDETVKQESTDLIDSRSSTVVNIPKRRVSGVRCFPPGCGKDAAYLNKEDLEKALADSKNHRSSCKICTKEEEPFVEEEEGEQEETVKQESTDLTDSRSSNVVNIPRRRVSGVRCFPPGCGKDAAYLNKEDLEKALADSKNHHSSCEICTKEEEPFMEEEEEGEQEDDEVVVVEVMEEEEEDEMVEEEEEEEEEEMEEVMMTDDKEGRMEAKFERQRVVVIALKASRSPCTQNARAKPKARGELKEEEEEIGTTDFKEEQRVVVQALMASTRCPWRNSRKG